MCGRFVRKEDKELLESRFGCDVPGGVLLKPEYNIAPSQDCPVVTVEGDRRVLGLMRWGLVPSWADDVKVGYRMINARAETLSEKTSFKTLLRKSRCLVPASGFYEWKKSGGGKTPYYFGLRGGDPFAFAGLWTVWRAGGEDEIRSFTIITTSANGVMAPIHDRMPVILHEKDEARWLDPELGKTEDLLPLLVPYPAEGMEYWEVSPYVNSWKHLGEECIKPVSSSP